MFAVLAGSQRALGRAGGEPLLHPAVFRDGGLRAGLATQAICWCSQASFFLILALYLQEGMHLSPLGSGSVFTILAGSYLAASLRAPALTARFGRDLIMAGALVVAAGDLALLWAVSSTTRPSVALLVPGLALVGAGQGLWITPLTTTVLSFADPERAGVVSGTLSTMQQVGNSVGVAVIGVVYFDALHHGNSTAFSWSLIALVVGLAIASMLTRLVRAPTQSSTVELAGAEQG
jgi:fucose permease